MTAATAPSFAPTGRAAPRVAAPADPAESDTPGDDPDDDGTDTEAAG